MSSSVLVILIGLIMIGTNIMFSWLELRPFLDAMSVETKRTRTTWSKITLIFRVVRHAPKLLPTIIDISSMLLLTSLFNLGTGFAGGVAGLFASNVISIIVYYHTHWKKKPIHAY